MSRLIMLAAVALFVIPTTAVAKSKHIVYTNYRLNFVKLVNLKGKELQQRAPTHPATLSVEQLRNMLGSIRIHRKALLKKGKILEDRNVFDDKALDILAPHMVDAFRQASAKQVVVFSYLFKNPKSILRNDRFTTGKAWVKDNELHVEFVKVYAKVIGDIDKRGMSNKALGKAKGLRIALEPGPNQMLGSTSPREIIMDLSKTYVGAGEHAIPETPTERLEELKRLREMNLITEKEFKAKRQAILRQL